MASVVYKNRTRDEIIAASRESIRKKHEWQEQAEQEIENKFVTLHPKSRSQFNNNNSIMSITTIQS